MSQWDKYKHKPWLRLRIASLSHGNKSIQTPSDQ